MNDPIVHVVLDASVVLPWLLPKSVSSDKLLERARMLINSRIEHHWPSIRLYVPGIVAAETQSILDRYRLCTWSNPLKKDPARRATKAEYSKARSKFEALVGSRHIERIDHAADHVWATRLISPVNARYQFRRQRSAEDAAVSGKRPIPQPMGAADCLIIGTAVSLGIAVGSQNVVVATADTRMSDVMRKIRRLKQKAVDELELDRYADRIGVRWEDNLFPRCINLRNATEQQLASAFQGWPLHMGKWHLVRDETDLTIQNQRELIRIYKEHKERTGLGVDRLPYSRELDAMRIRMVCLTGRLVSNNLIYSLLSKWRKAGMFTDKTSSPSR